MSNQFVRLTRVVGALCVAGVSLGAGPLAAQECDAPGHGDAESEAPSEESIADVVVPRPEPLPVPRNPAMAHAGMVLSGLGGVFAVAGGIGLIVALRNDKVDQYGTAAGAVMGGGGGLLAIGVPLWSVGSAPRERRTPWVVNVTPVSAALGVRF